MRYSELAPFFMRMLITKKELRLRKCREKIPLECEICKSVFYRPKNYVLRGIKGTRTLSTCGEKCRRIFISKSLKKWYTNPDNGNQNLKPTTLQNFKRMSMKKELVKIAGGQCAICGYNKSVNSLEFHHKNPKEKSFKISCGLTRKYPKEKLISEIKKCALVCRNCHGELNDGTIKL